MPLLSPTPTVTWSPLAQAGLRVPVFKVITARSFFYNLNDSEFKFKFELMKDSDS